MREDTPPVKAVKVGVSWGSSKPMRCRGGNNAANSCDADGWSGEEFIVCLKIQLISAWANSSALKA